MKNNGIRLSQSHNEEECYIEICHSLKILEAVSEELFYELFKQISEKEVKMKSLSSRLQSLKEQVKVIQSHDSEEIEIAYPTTYPLVASVNSNVLELKSIRDLAHPLLKAKAKYEFCNNDDPNWDDAQELFRFFAANANESLKLPPERALSKEHYGSVSNISQHKPPATRPGSSGSASSSSSSISGADFKFLASKSFNSEFKFRPSASPIPNLKINLQPVLQSNIPKQQEIPPDSKRNPQVFKGSSPQEMMKSAQNPPPAMEDLSGSVPNSMLSAPLTLKAAFTEAKKSEVENVAIPSEAMAVLSSNIPEPPPIPPPRIPPPPPPPPKMLPRVPLPQPIPALSPNVLPPKSESGSEKKSSRVEQASAPGFDVSALLESIRNPSIALRKVDTQSLGPVSRVDEKPAQANNIQSFLASSIAKRRAAIQGTNEDIGSGDEVDDSESRLQILRRAVGKVEETAEPDDSDWSE